MLIICAEKENFKKYKQQIMELTMVQEKVTKSIRKRKLSTEESAGSITSSLVVAVYLVVIEDLWLTCL